MGKSHLFHPPDGEEDQHSYHTPLEKKLRHVLTPFEEFTQSQITASFFLLLCTIIALVWASLPTLSDYYNHLVNFDIGIHIGKYIYVNSFKIWVNDLLLTLFFFFVGLEIKREFLVGELANRKRAMLVLISAIGGMLVPAGIYYAFNYHLPTAKGWGIPMATDTAFALGILACFRRTLPKGVFTFMAAIAIIDDIGAILVIAFFYTTNLNLTLLGIAALLVGVLIIANYSGIRRVPIYLIIGLIIWALTEAAGIHGTVAGIVVAFTIPARPRKGPKQFLKRAKELLAIFERRKEETPLILKDEKQHAILEEVQEITTQATTPLQRWESALEQTVALMVLPLFALVNAGIQIRFSLLDEAITTPVSLGIILGLVVGKPLGISLFCRICLWCKLGTLPNETTFAHIINVAILAGIGFTMSLFIGTLAFEFDPHTLLLAKTGIILSSLIAGIIGSIGIAFTKRL